MKKYRVKTLHMEDECGDGFDTEEEAVQYGLSKKGEGVIVILLRQVFGGRYEVIAEIR